MSIMSFHWCWRHCCLFLLSVWLALGIGWTGKPHTQAAAAIGPSLDCCVGPHGSSSVPNVTERRLFSFKSMKIYQGQTLAGSQHRLYGVGYDDQVLALDDRTGELLWSYNASADPVLPQPIQSFGWLPTLSPDATVLYALLDPVALLAFNAQNGTVRWHRLLNASGFLRSPFVDPINGLLSIVSLENGFSTLYSISPYDGGILSNRIVGLVQSAALSPLHSFATFPLLVLSAGTNMTLFSLPALQPVWSVSLPLNANQIVMSSSAQGVVYVIATVNSSATSIDCYQLTNGSFVWEILVQRVITHPAAMADGSLVYADDNCNLFCIGSNGVLQWSIGSLLNQPPGVSGVSLPLLVATDDWIYVVAFDTAGYWLLAVSPDQQIAWTYNIGYPQVIDFLLTTDASVALVERPVSNPAATGIRVVLGCGTGYHLDNATAACLSDGLTPAWSSDGNGPGGAWNTGNLLLAVTDAHPAQRNFSVSLPAQPLELPQKRADRILRGPVVDSAGVLYLMDELAGRLVAVATQSVGVDAGAELWGLPLPDGWHSLTGLTLSPDGSMLFLLGSGQLLAISTHAHSQVWVAPNQTLGTGSMLIVYEGPPVQKSMVLSEARGSLFVCLQSAVFELDWQTGTLRRVFTVPLEPMSPLVLLESHALLFFAGPQLEIYAYNVNSGAQLWAQLGLVNFSLAATISPYPILLLDTGWPTLGLTVVALGTQHFAQLNALTGQPLISWESGSFATAVLAAARQSSVGFHWFALQNQSLVSSSLPGWAQHSVIQLPQDAAGFESFSNGAAALGLLVDAAGTAVLAGQDGQLSRMDVLLRNGSILYSWSVLDPELSCGVGNCSLHPSLGPGGASLLLTRSDGRIFQFGAFPSQPITAGPIGGGAASSSSSSSSLAIGLGIAVVLLVCCVLLPLLAWFLIWRARHQHSSSSSAAAAATTTTTTTTASSGGTIRGSWLGLAVGRGARGGESYARVESIPMTDRDGPWSGETAYASVPPQPAKDLPVDSLAAASSDRMRSAPIIVPHPNAVVGVSPVRHPPNQKDQNHHDYAMAEHWTEDDVAGGDGAGGSRSGGSGGGGGGSSDSAVASATARTATINQGKVRSMPRAQTTTTATKQQPIPTSSIEGSSSASSSSSSSGGGGGGHNDSRSNSSSNKNLPRAKEKQKDKARAAARAATTTAATATTPVQTIGSSRAVFHGKPAAAAALPSAGAAPRTRIGSVATALTSTASSSPTAQPSAVALVLRTDSGRVFSRSSQRSAYANVEVRVPEAALAYEYGARDEVGTQADMRAQLELDRRRATPPPELSQYQSLKLFGPMVIGIEELTMEEELGRGQFGVVHRALWRPKRAGAPATAVAVKMLLSKSVGSVEEFEREGRIMMSIPMHPHVVNLLATVVYPHPALVTELMTGGSLVDFLRESEEPMTLEMAIHFALDIAKGMEHLHAHNIIHRDLATRNVLMTYPEMLCKVSDYGLARVLTTAATSTSPTNHQYTRMAIGPVKWMAPEALLKRQYSRATDVYSFGITLQEIFSRNDPYPALSPMAVVAESARGLRPTLPGYLPEPIVQMVKQCWHADPTARPSFSNIVQYLQSLLA